MKLVLDPDPILKQKAENWDFVNHVNASVVEREMLETMNASNGIGLAGNQVGLPRLLSAAYALAIAAQGGAKRIMLAGFDGFATDDHRFKEMDDVFQSFTQLKGSPHVVSITRTRYNVERSSMSAPL